MSAAIAEPAKASTAAAASVEIEKRFFMDVPPVAIPAIRLP
jgi:hypothetical protein